MTLNPTDDDAELVAGWSCDERKRAACRNGHGCHCREITSLRGRLLSIEAETRADEREACAKIADEFGMRDNAKARGARLIATAIRNREA